jgi:hypothetical protein
MRWHPVSATHHRAHPFVNGGLSRRVGGNDINPKWLEKSSGLSSELCVGGLEMSVRGGWVQETALQPHMTVTLRIVAVSHRAR